MLVHKQVTAFMTTFLPKYFMPFRKNTLNLKNIYFFCQFCHYLTNLNSKKSEQTHNHDNKIKDSEK